MNLPVEHLPPKRADDSPVEDPPLDVFGYAHFRHWLRSKKLIESAPKPNFRANLTLFFGAYAPKLASYLNSDRTPFTSRSAQKTLFFPAAQDVPHRVEGTRWRKTLRGLRVTLPGESAPLRIQPGTFGDALMHLIDGNRNFCQLQRETVARCIFVDDQAWRTFFTSTVGRCVEFPAAIAHLESRISSVEIARFPTTPYRLPVDYWRNMGLVREVITDSLSSAAADGKTFEQFLRRLHRLSLLGPDGWASYVPFSMLESGDGIAGPGEFVEHDIFDFPPSISFFENTMAAKYAAVLARSADANITAACRHMMDDIDWGAWHVVPGTRLGRFFVREMPRPLCAGHFESLAQLVRMAWAAGESREYSTFVDALSRLHYRYNALNMFRSGNHSLIMNIINYLLRRFQDCVVPHGNMDWLSFMLPEKAYGVLFKRYLAAYKVPVAEIAAKETMQNLQKKFDFADHAARTIARNHDPAPVHLWLSRLDAQQRQWFLLGEQA